MSIMPDKWFRTGTSTVAGITLSFLVVAVLTGCTVTVSDGGGGRQEPADVGVTPGTGDGTTDQDGGTGGGGDQEPGPGGDQEPGPVTGAEPEETGLLQGKVTDPNGAALGGVAVTAGTAASPVLATTATNEQGFYTIDDLDPVDRMFVVYEQDGYAQAAKITEIAEGLSSFVEVVLTPIETTQSVPAAAGGVVTTDSGAIVELPENGLVDSTGAPFTGTATVNLTAFDPSTDEGIAAFPGAFEGVLEDGTRVPFSSYGFVDVTLTDEDGNTVSLAPNNTAGLTVPIPDALVDEAPETIDLWFFDDSDGEWHHEGTATKEGSTYRARVSHFTPWNCDDRWSGFSGVIGRVIDCITGEPIRGARVVIQGVNWTAEENSTGSDGRFNIAARVDQTAVIYAEKDGIRSEAIPITTLPGGSAQPLDVGDICLSAPRIQVTLVWGQNPRDLDAHLTFPMDDGTRGHVLYNNKTQGSVKLDTDDTTSYGPEIITVFALNDGTYRYSVHHFAGSEVISNSEARATMVISGLGAYTATPPAGAQATKDAWRVWEITVENGVVTDIAAINQYFNNVDHNDTTAFRPRRR